MWRISPVTQSTLYSMLRGMLPSAVCGPISMIMLGKPSTMHAEIGLRPARPFVLQPQPADAADVDAVEAAGDGIEAGGVDDDVELEFRIAGLDARRA